MATVYKAERIRLKWNLTVTTQAGGPAGATVWAVEHNMWCKAAVRPTGGQAADQIQLLTRAGNTRTAADWIDEYTARVVVNRWRYGPVVNGGGATIGETQIFFYEEESDVGLEITSHAPGGGHVWNPTSGSNIFASSAIMTLKGTDGSRARLQFNHGRSTPGVSMRIPSTNNDINLMAEYILSDASCVRTRSGVPVHIAQKWLPGENEKLWANVYRP